jgi:hypothetical protein
MIKIIKWIAVIFLLIASFGSFTSGEQSLGIIQASIGIFYLYGLLTGKT